MKLSVSAYRAHASASKKILTHKYSTSHNYGSTASTQQQVTFNRDMDPTNDGGELSISKANSPEELESSGNEDPGRKGSGNSSPPNRSTKSNQRWMKLRTTVQLSGAITSTIQKKPPLKREDSFLKRFSTRQIPELQETLDTGDDGEGDSEGTTNGSKGKTKKHKKKKKKVKKSPATVVNPDGDFFYYWMLLVTVCVLYNLWTLIVRQSFPELQQDHSVFWMCCDVFSDIVFILDVGVQFRTGYLEQGLMVFDWKKLSGHYMKSKAFLLDLGALFPLELLQLNYGVKPILRCPRFFKIHRVYAYYYIVESRTIYPNVLRVMNLIHILLILAHWFGCFYYLLSEAEDFQGDWVYPYRPGAYATLARKYLASLYWSTLTLTTIGDLPTPETNVDSSDTDRLQNLLRRGHKSRILQFNSNRGYVFTIVGYLIGVFIFATIVGQVGNVITNRNANRLEFERLLDGAKTYMRHHKVPSGMQRTVLRWYDYSWSRGRIQGGGDINTALGLLPDKLKTELALHVNLSVLKKVTIFQECQPEFLHDLVLKMKAYIFTPGDLICRKGEVAREMFIIADGILEVMSENGRVLTTMRAGDFFGEIGILNLDGFNKRTADVRSVGYSELFSLSREDVLNAMKDYPEAQEILQSLGRKRLKEAQSVNRAYKHSALQQKERRAALALSHVAAGDTSKTSRLEKLRSDVKELKNVLKKSTRNTRNKSDALELEPLTKAQGREMPSSSKGVLCRTARIYNDDTSYEEENPSSPPHMNTSLPLFQRLKLLKEKQDLEKAAEAKRPVPSPSPSDSADRKDAEGSSMPLLHRFLNIKSKDESETSSMQSTAQMTAQVLASTVFHQSRVKQKTMGEEQKKCGTVKFKDDLSGRAPKLLGKSEVSPDVEHILSSEEQAVRPTSHLNVETSTDNESWNLIKRAVVHPTASCGSTAAPANIEHQRMDQLNWDLERTFDSDKPEKGYNTDQGEMNMHIAQVMTAQGDCVENMSTSLGKSAQTTTNSGPLTFNPKKGKTGKIYRSIDDLSPEYNGLPFVKKLKILNERQKLAELEKRTFVKRTSLDSAGGVVEEVEEREDGPPLTRSHSEALAIEVVLRNQNSRNTTGESSSSQQRFSNGEDNETEERRELKSILKKLSSTSLLHDGPPVACSTSRSMDDATHQMTDMKKLMRAQTVEGYAARHSKFAKSVTFNKVAIETTSLPSTPSTDNVFVDSNRSQQPIAAIQWDLSTNASQIAQGGGGGGEHTVDSSTFANPDVIPITVSSTNSNVKEERGPSAAPSSVQNSSSNSPEWSPRVLSPIPPMRHYGELSKMPFGRAAPEKREKVRGLGAVFQEIRQLLEGHLDKIECKYVHHFYTLEQEVRKRDTIISQLQRRIQELERGASVDTTILKSNVTESAAGRSEELQPWQLSQTMSDAGDSPSVNIRVESSSSETEDEHLYNADWEIQLLVKQLNEREGTWRRRAISFDSAQPTSSQSLYRSRSFDPEQSQDIVSAPASAHPQKTNDNFCSYSRSLSISSLQKAVTSTITRGFNLIQNGVPSSSPDVVPTMSKTTRLPPLSPSSNL